MYKTVMITGASGYIGSWTVKELLEKGYTVRACVRDKNNAGKVQHLLDLAKTCAGKLELWEADLLKEGSFDAAARGCDAVFHMASPFTLRFKDAQKELIDPALQGTRNVLSAATRSGTVKKVILTSSIVAVFGDNIDMKEKGLSEFTEAEFQYNQQPHPSTICLFKSTGRKGSMENSRCTKSVETCGDEPWHLLWDRCFQQLRIPKACSL